MDHDTTGTLTRRRLLKSGAGAVTAAGAVASGTGSASAQQDAYDGYLSEVDNFAGETADARGLEEITVTVGAGAQGLLFEPAAVVIDPGTTVEFEWTGEGGAHNVSNDVDDPVFRSGDAVNDEGVLYDFTFEEEHEGAHPYVCEPHDALEMKGVIAVGDDALETPTFDFGAGDAGFNTAAVFGVSAVFGAISLLGAAAYHDKFGRDE